MNYNSIMYPFFLRLKYKLRLINYITGFLRIDNLYEKIRHFYLNLFRIFFCLLSNVYYIYQIYVNNYFYLFHINNNIYLFFLPLYIILEISSSGDFFILPISIIFKLLFFKLFFAFFSSEYLILFL